MCLLSNPDKILFQPSLIDTVHTKQLAPLIFSSITTRAALNSPRTEFTRGTVHIRIQYWRANKILVSLMQGKKALTHMHTDGGDMT
jgi:hypothetical protein